MLQSSREIERTTRGRARRKATTPSIHQPPEEPADDAAGWAAADEPDPTGALLRQLVPVLEAMVPAVATARAEAARAVAWVITNFPVGSPPILVPSSSSSVSVLAS